MDTYHIFKKENNVSLEENFEETLTVPYKKKDLFCFIKSDVSWHAVKKLEISQEVLKRLNEKLPAVKVVFAKNK